MRKLVRDAVAEARRLGASVVRIDEAGRHTEILIERNGVRGVLRLHRGSIVTHRAARALRSSIRGIGS